MQSAACRSCPRKLWHALPPVRGQTQETPVSKTAIFQKRELLLFLKARAKISSQNLRSDLVQILPIRLSKTTGIAGYFADFANEASVKDGLKLRCKNVKLFLREP